MLYWKEKWWCCRMRSILDKGVMVRMGRSNLFNPETTKSKIFCFKIRPWKFFTENQQGPFFKITTSSKNLEKLYQNRSFAFKKPIFWFWRKNVMTKFKLNRRSKSSMTSFIFSKASSCSKLPLGKNCWNCSRSWLWWNSVMGSMSIKRVRRFKICISSKQAKLRFGRSRKWSRVHVN